MKSREHVTTNGKAVFYATMWNDLRHAAMDKGWALALHGSLATDMDVMAMPWTENACSADEMAEALKGCFTEADCIKIRKTPKPNNRLIYTLSIWADFYLDINIIKAAEQPEAQKEKDVLKQKQLVYEFASWLSEQDFTNPDISKHDWVESFFNSDTRKNS